MYHKIGLTVIDADSGKERPLAGCDAYPRWSPDGKYIAYVDDRTHGMFNSDVWIVPAAGGEARRIASGSFPVWSRDSRRLFYLSKWRDGDLYAVNIDIPTATPERIMACPGRYALLDDHTLIYATPTEVCLAEMPSGKVIHRWSMPWPVWCWVVHSSPKRDEIYLCSSSWYSHSGVWALNLKDKRLRHVLNSPVFSAVPSPDSSRLALTVRDELYLLDQQGDVPIYDTLGTGESMDEYLQGQIQEQTLAIDADPIDVEAYFERAQAYLALSQYDPAADDLKVFAKLLTSDDKHLFYMIRWWVWRYQEEDLYQGGELLALTAIDLIHLFPDIQLGSPSGNLHPVKNLISIYEKWGKPELAEKWRVHLAQD
jgi:hypothetical protein